MLSRMARLAADNAYLLLSLMALFWAGNQVLGRAVAGHVPPVMLSFLRWTLASLIVLPFAWEHLKHDWPVVREKWMFLAFLGIMGGGAFNTLQYLGLNYTTALNSLVLNSTGPILIALACMVIFKDRLTGMQMVGTAISLVGVLTVVSHGDLDLLLSLTLNRGDLLILLGMIITAVYTAYLRLRPDIHWLTFILAQFVASAIFNAPLIVVEAAVSHAEFRLSTFSLLSIAYVAIFPSIVAFACFMRGVQLIGPVRAGIFLHMIPLFGAVLAIGLLGEPLAAYHVAGFVLILAGVALTSRKA